MIHTAAPRGTARLPAWDKLVARRLLLAPPPWRSIGRDRLTVVLHTFQTRGAYESLRREGVLAGDSTRAIPEFREAYAWMSTQMGRHRLGGGAGEIIWLWANITRRHLRRAARDCSGEVLLSVQVARDRALFSDFNAWHDVLNRVLHVPRERGENAEAWDARWEELDNAFRARAEPYDDQPLATWPIELRAELETSWEAIFDPATWPRYGDRQATMRVLRAEDVVRAVRIR